MGRRTRRNAARASDRLEPFDTGLSIPGTTGDRKPDNRGVEQLSGLDAAFVYFEAAGAAHVTFFAIYDPSTAAGGRVTFEDVATHIGSRLGADHLFRSVLARVPFDLDHPYWVHDENFQLSRHLHHLTLPKPGGWRQLCDQVSQLHEQQMDLRRPPWECYFINGLVDIQESPGRCVRRVLQDSSFGGRRSDGLGYRKCAP